MESLLSNIVGPAQWTYSTVLSLVTTLVSSAAVVPKSLSGARVPLTEAACATTPWPELRIEGVGHAVGSVASGEVAAGRMVDKARRRRRLGFWIVQDIHCRRA